VGLFGEKNAQEVEVAGQPLRCEICHHTRFWQRQAQLNTSVATFFNFDWANASATCIVCERCGYIHWFLPPD
jgi:hypothetical protein